MGFCVCSMFCCALLCALSTFEINLIEKRELISLPCLSSWFLEIVIDLWLLLPVTGIGLQCVIVVHVFPDNKHLL